MQVNTFAEICQAVAKIGVKFLWIAVNMNLNLLFEILCKAHDAGIRGQVLLKVHIGEPNCDTRMRPEFTGGSIRFLCFRGATSVVAGDTTVAYTGQRGHRENPHANVEMYVRLARRHGWSAR